MAHCRASRDRREMLPRVLASWDGRVDMVICDDKFAGAWSTVRAAWEEALELSGGKGHLMVAQDDMRLAKGGADMIEGICAARPDDVLSFRWSDESEAWMESWVEAEDQCFVQVADIWSGGCAAVPAPLVKRFLAWSVQWEKVLREVPYHKPEYVDDMLKHRDDTRLDCAFLAWDIPVWRCRWSLLEHLGDVSEVRMGVRPPSVEVNLVRDVAELPPLTDPRWTATEVPTCLTVPDGYRNLVEVLFGDHADRLGLGHCRFQYERSI